MKAICKRVKEYRNQLNLSQGYAANCLGMDVTTYTQMENGNREITK